MPAPENTPAVPAPDRPPPKRRFWQIHLSTAVVMMVVAGFLAFLNFSKETFNLGERPYNYFRSSEQFESYGWPWKWLTRQEGTVQDFELRPMAGRPWEFKLLSLTGSMVVALLMLTGTAVALEYLIRRRSKP
jgi:hypothetical protein